MSEYIDFEQGVTYGLFYGIVAIGMSLALRFLRTADLTAIGSMMLGGIACVFFTNKFGVLGGIASAMLLCGGLGFLTALISDKLKIDPLLAGIITSTATISLSLYLANGSSIDLQQTDFLSSIFSWTDTFAIALIAAFICGALGMLAVSKYGTLAFALAGNPRFVKFRHRSGRVVIFIIFVVSNSIVGLGSALLALKTKAAYVAENKLEFIWLCLGAVFAGDAAVRLLSRFVRKEVEDQIAPPELAQMGAPDTGWFHRFRLSLSVQRDDSARMWFILVSYILASVFLNTVTLTVRSQRLPFKFSAHWEYFIVACIILLGLAISNAKPKSQRK